MLRSADNEEEYEKRGREAKIQNNVESKKVRREAWREGWREGWREPPRALEGLPKGSHGA